MIRAHTLLAEVLTKESAKILGEYIDNLDKEIIRLRSYEKALNDSDEKDDCKVLGISLEIRSLANKLEAIRNFSSMSFNLSSRETFDKWNKDKL